MPTSYQPQLPPDLTLCPGCQRLSPTSHTYCHTCDTPLPNTTRYEKSGYQISISIIDPNADYYPEIAQINSRVARYFKPFRKFLYISALILASALLLIPSFLNSSSLVFFAPFAALLIMLAFACSGQNISKSTRGAKLRSSFIFIYAAVFMISTPAFVLGQAITATDILSLNLLEHPFIIVFGVLSVASLALALFSYSSYEFTSSGISLVKKRVLIKWSEVAFVYRVEIVKKTLLAPRGWDPIVELRIQLKEPFKGRYIRSGIANHAGIVAINWLPFSFKIEQFLDFLSQFPVLVELRRVSIDVSPKVT